MDIVEDKNRRVGARAAQVDKRGKDLAPIRIRRAEAESQRAFSDTRMHGLPGGQQGTEKVAGVVVFLFYREPGDPGAGGVSPLREQRSIHGAVTLPGPCLHPLYQLGTQPSASPSARLSPRRGDLDAIGQWSAACPVGAGGCRRQTGAGTGSAALIARVQRGAIAASGMVRFRPAAAAAAHPTASAGGDDRAATSQRPGGHRQCGRC